MSPPAIPFDPASSDKPVERHVVDGVLFLKTSPVLIAPGLVDSLVDTLAAWADETGPNPIRVVIDLTETRLDVSGHELRRGAFRVHGLGATGRLALCVASDFQFGLGRMFGMLCDGSGLVVYPFRDLEAARRWAIEELGPTEP